NTSALAVGDHAIRLIVSGQCGSETNGATLTVQPITSATVLTDLETCQGQDADFDMVASGVGPFDYQWRLDGTALGTNGPSLTIPTTELSLGDHALTVEVTGQCGPTLTNAATLTIQEPTTASELTDLVRYSGQSASFNIIASGAGQLSYQWRKNGVEIPGETNSTLILVSLTDADAASYSAVVSGSCNALTNTA